MRLIHYLLFIPPTLLGGWYLGSKLGASFHLKKIYLLVNHLSIFYHQCMLINPSRSHIFIHRDVLLNIRLNNLDSQKSKRQIINQIHQTYLDGRSNIYLTSNHIHIIRSL